MFSLLGERLLSVAFGRVARVVPVGGINIYSMGPGEPPKMAEVFVLGVCVGIETPVIGLYLSLYKM